jgi:hypothetical protein
MSYNGQNHLASTELAVPAYSSQASELINEVNDDIDKLADGTPCLFNLTKSIDENAALTWIDWMHLTPTGNEIIAKEMVHVLQTTPCVDE